MYSRIGITALLLAARAVGQNHLTPPGSLNKPERMEWFRDTGLGCSSTGRWIADRRGDFAFAGRRG